MNVLPTGFESLTSFVPTWSEAGEIARANTRSTTTPELLSTFYEAAQPMLVPALEYLDTRPLNALGDADKRLLRIMLSLAHAAQTVEVQGDAEAKHVKMRAKLQIANRSAF